MWAMTERDGRAAPEAEKRLHGVRLRKYIDVVVEDRSSSMLFRGAIADITESGMRLIADQYLPKGTRYIFTMKRTPYLSLRGEVRWIKPFERDTFQVGVYFVEISADALKRLSSFLEIERARLTILG